MDAEAPTITQQEHRQAIVDFAIRCTRSEPLDAKELKAIMQFVADLEQQEKEIKDR